MKITKIFILFIIINLYGNFANAANIIIKGNVRIENETIKNYAGDIEKLNLKDAQIRDQIAKKIFETGLFKDVNIKLENNNIIINLIENPMINKIVIEGNKRIDDDKILPYLSLKPKNMINNYLLNEDIKKIITIYQVNGRYATEVQPKIIELEGKRVNLVFEINEGEKAKISHINFSGNSKFGDFRLREVIETKEKKWYRFFTMNDSYNAERLEGDKELLKNFYKDRGYANVKIADPVVKFSNNKDEVLIYFLIEEGEKFKFGNINYKNEIHDESLNEIKKFIHTTQGDFFEYKLIEKTINDVSNYLGNKGYAFTNVNPNVELDFDKKIAHIEYIISPTPKYYIRQINIKGNEKTADHVIRREFRLNEGDPFSQNKFDRSKQAIEDLDFFDKVEMDIKQEGNDVVDIDVKIEEKSTGYASLAAGFQPNNGVIGKIGFTENNLFGEGKFASIELMKSEKDLDVEFSYTDPYFQDHNYAVGFDIVHSQNKRRRQTLYEEKTDSISPRLTYRLYNDLDHTISYSFKKQHVSNIDKDAPLYIKGQKGKSTTSMITNSFIFDKRDSKLHPEKGYYLSVAQSIAGLGGSKRFIMHTAKAAYYTPVINEQIIFSLQGDANHIKGIGGRQVRIEDRFYMGGNDLKGFGSFGVGPRDKATRDSLGGNFYYMTNAQLAFPIGLPKEINIKGLIFANSGSLFGVDVKNKIDKNNFYNTKTLRAAVGVGIMWDSNIGSIGIYYGRAVKSAKYDHKKPFSIFVSTPF